MLSLPFESGLGGGIFFYRYGTITWSTRSARGWLRTPQAITRLAYARCWFLSSIIELQAPGNRSRRSGTSGSSRSDWHNAR